MANSFFLRLFNHCVHHFQVNINKKLIYQKTLICLLVCVLVRCWCWISTAGSFLEENSWECVCCVCWDAVWAGRAPCPCTSTEGENKLLQPKHCRAQMRGVYFRESRHDWWVFDYLVNLFDTHDQNETQIGHVCRYHTCIYHSYLSISGISY